MSATLLCCVLVLRILASASYINNHDGGLIPALDEKSLSRNGITVVSPNKRILIEEVDKNGNSVVKELELPDYDESEELEEDRRRREEQEKEYQNEESNKWQDMYGCDKGSGSQLRKCLRRQKKLLKQRYKDWKIYIRKIIKDLDGKIRTLGRIARRGSRAESLNFMSGFSPKNVMRKKE